MDYDYRDYVCDGCKHYIHGGYCMKFDMENRSQRDACNSFILDREQ